MIRWATHRAAVIWALAAGILIAGAVAFTKLPLSTKSATEFPELTITDSWPGSSPELMESYVTAPIESAVQSVRGVRTTQSTSSSGSCVITVVLEPDADVTMTRLSILERLQALHDDLPPAAAQQMAVFDWTPDDLQQKPLVEINVIGPYTPGALKQIAVDRIQPVLEAVPGVASVGANGGANMGLSVSYDPTRLGQLGIDPAALRTALSSARLVEALGSVHDGPYQYSVVVRDQPHLTADLARLPVIAPGGRVFLLGDLAAIRPEEDNGGVFYRLNGVTAVSLSLTRQPQADAIRTAAAVNRAVASLAPQMPPGVRLRIANDESIDLRHQLDDLLLRGAIAFAAVLLVLLVTLRSAGRSLLVLGSAAVAIAGASLSLYLLHIPANLLTLAGLAMGIGILVQNGLVVVERLRWVDDTPDGRAHAGERIASAVMGSTLTTTVVLLPFLYLQGDSRAEFTPFAAAFALALAWSVGVALIVVPAVGRGGRGSREGVKGWPRLGRLYQRMMFGVLRWRLAAIAFTALAIGVLTWGFIKKVPRVSWGNWYEQQHQIITASVGFPKGSDPEKLNGIISELEHVAIGRPGVALVRSSGNNLAGTVEVEFTADGSASDMPWVISDELTQRAVLIGGTDYVNVSKPEGPGYYNSSGSGTQVSHSLTLKGYSYDGVLQLALDLQARLERIPRVRSVDIEAAGRWGTQHTVSVVLTPDRQALSRIGATAENFNNSVSQQLRGSGGGTTMEINNQSVPGDPPRDRRQQPGSGAARRRPGEQPRAGAGADRRRQQRERSDAGEQHPAGRSAVHPLHHLRLPRTAEAG